MKCTLIFAGLFTCLFIGCSQAPNFSKAAGVKTKKAAASAQDVRSFGAKCDGVTDDSSAILAALQSGQPAVLPVGTCAVSSAILFGGARIEGATLTGSVLKWVGPPPTMPISVTTSQVVDNLATVNTSAPHELWPHETVVIQGNSNSVFNGTFLVVSTPSPTSFTFVLTGPNAAGGGGHIGMYYMADSSRQPTGARPPFMGFNAGWISDLTIDCNSTPGLSGLFQLGDSGDAINLHIQNCLDGYTAAQTYMNPMSHVAVDNSTGQGAFIKNLGANNGAATGGSVWANGFGTYGIHIRGTIGSFDLLYAQRGSKTAIYPFYFEGDGPGVTRSGTLQCSSCVADGAGGINSFYIRRYYVQLDSPAVATTAPSQNVFVFDDAWGQVNNADVYPIVAPGFYTFKSLGNSVGLTGQIILVGGGGTIDPVGASDFSTFGFAMNSPLATTSMPNGSAADPVLSFIGEPDLGWYRAANGVMAIASMGKPVFAVSPGGLGVQTSINLCSDPVNGPCDGGFSSRGPDELGVLDHNGTWAGGNFSVNILKLGVNSNDTGISRYAPGRFAFGNGKLGDMSGIVYAGNYVQTGTSAPTGAAVCYKSDKSLGYCTTPFTGTPPICKCK
jgi:hypothetical protein